MGFTLILWMYATSISAGFAIEYKESYFDQTIDHFNFQYFGDQKFKQRYFYNDIWWERGRGPIFFYAGNESPLESGWKSNGYIVEMAPFHKAFVLFVEHRYYGESLPFGKNSFKDPEIGWLSIEQTLADFATFLTSFRKQYNAENCPIIAFGVSYGGMLSTYMRFKYPNIIQGAISSSAPILQTAGITSGDFYYLSVTQSFRNVSAECESQVRAAFRQLHEWYEKGAKGLKKISREMRLCRQLKSNDDYDHFLRWVRNGFGGAAANNFPYPEGDYQAFPVKGMCHRLLAKGSPVSGLRSACGVPYNSTGKSKCFDIPSSEHTLGGYPGDYRSESLKIKAWDYQLCTEVNLEGNTYGGEDMFPVLLYTSSMRDEYCRKTWGVTPRRDWLSTQYWGKDMSSSSNIVFSNGNLDPWAPGSVHRDISDTIVAIMIEDAAHHLDLRASNQADPQPVLDARDFEVRHINNWINQFYQEKNAKSEK